MIRFFAQSVPFRMDTDSIKHCSLEAIRCDRKKALVLLEALVIRIESGDIMLEEYYEDNIGASDGVYWLHGIIFASHPRNYALSMRNADHLISVVASFKEVMEPPTVSKAILPHTSFSFKVNVFRS